MDIEKVLENLEQFNEVKARFSDQLTVSISGKSGRLSLNKTFWNEVKEKFGKETKYLYILHTVDSGSHFIGLRFSKDKDKGAVAISAYIKSGASASIKSFLTKNRLISDKTRSFEIKKSRTNKFGEIYYLILNEGEKN